MATLSRTRVTGWASRWLTDELTAMSKAGDWEGALDTFTRMEQSNLVHQNVYHYTSVITACGRAGQVDTALFVFQQMKRNKVKPNVYTYTAVMNACGVAGRTDTALRMFAEMRLTEVAPNVQAMTALTAACARTGRWETALKVLKESEDLFVAPNVFTYTAAMDGCRRAGVSRPAVELLSHMRNPANVRPNEVTYNTVLGACRASNDYEAALPVYARMVADGYQPLEYTRSLLIDLFRTSPLEGLADTLEVRQKLTKWKLYLPDSDPATAMRATQDSDEADERDIPADGTVAGAGQL